MKTYATLIFLLIACFSFGQIQQIQPYSGWTEEDDSLYKDYTITWINAITPDGDGVNDSLVFACNGEVKTFSLEVYSRWGELVFFEEGNRIAWDGKHHEMKNGFSSSKDTYKMGVYVWRIKWKDNITDQEKEYKGHITVLPDEPNS